MRTRFLLLTVLVAMAQLSCGGTPFETPVDRPPELEVTPPDPLQTMTSWPDAVDLGVVVFSEVVPLTDPPPPPELAR